MEGTGFKLCIPIAAHKAEGWDAEQLHEQFPHLSLSQIHSALAFYYDHTEEIDRQIAESAAFAEAMQQNPDPRSKALREKLLQHKQNQG
ncbi:MAG: hypothetical protein C4332_05585 [Meiothermus sp.]